MLLKLHHKLLKTPLAALRPTQMTVGMLEVENKQRYWQSLSEDERKVFLKNHGFPAVLGFNNQFFILDHHHLGLALLKENIEFGYLMVLKDYSQLDESTFWLMMEHQQWVHPYNNKGVRQPISKLPENLLSLTDDPYRSLAGEVRKAGGYSKYQTPYVEFLWADFFRKRIDLKNTTMANAVDEALKICHSNEANYLPGWTGKYDDLSD